MRRMSWVKCATMIASAMSFGRSVGKNCLDSIQ